MSLFDDVNRFLEEKLDEFMSNNPHLEAQALLEQLKEQERDTLKLIIRLEAQEQQLQQEILSLAEDIKIWHARVKKAQSAGETELSQKAAEREASLLHQGNLVWRQMEGAKKQILQAKELLKQIELQKQQIQQKSDSFTATPQSDSATRGWNQSTTYTKEADPLEQMFAKWETDQELEQIKRNLGL
ncbi:TIGR04376 family protein [Gloeocapsa sp. PCC 73106]|uniref:TIGR04376 family protein n=1 Tax=Gloeocapsa sp. PCC 73106 TaxID=102232 RepID=UPI0002AD19EC|nr:TIGR04376 family protein [Gloeocapsa sp. PCC 73106]ELR96551.1 hypothetical protein GLO73106DRAFT_00003460 [Gloeocapsa sp. PCC 73106]